MEPFQIQRNAANKGGVNKEKVLYREKINAQRLNLSSSMPSICFTSRAIKNLFKHI